MPPNNHKLDFYVQRIPAHVVFAMFATLGYATIQKMKQQKAVDEKAYRKDYLAHGAFPVTAK